MYILTKRASDGVQSWHNIHGHTDEVTEARIWYRATRTTDVVEVPDTHPSCSTATENDWEPHMNCSVSATRMESWREQQTRHEKEIARAKGATA